MTKFSPQRRLSTIAAALLVAGGAAMLASTPASAWQGLSGGLDCGNYQVMVSSTSKGQTYHYHYTSSAVYWRADWYNGSASTFRVSAYVNKVHHVQAEAATLSSASAGCDW